MDADVLCSLLPSVVTVGSLFPVSLSFAPANVSVSCEFTCNISLLAQMPPSPSVRRPSAGRTVVRDVLFA